MRPGSSAPWAALGAAVGLLLAGVAEGAPRFRAPSWRSYRDAVARWHAPTPGKSAPLDERGRPKLALSILNSGESIELAAESDEGGFDAEALARAAWALRDTRTGQMHPVEPMTLDMVYRAQRRFQAHEVRVVSGYRAPQGKRSSNHGRGRAVDLVVPGASDKDVAAWARELGFVGVGIYPNAGYCHLDVREQSYFWVDTSGPGQRTREAPTLKDLAKKSDEAARRAGRRPVPGYRLPSAPAGDAHAHEEEDAHD